MTLAHECGKHSGFENELKNLKEWQDNHTNVDHKYIWEALEEIRKRPPVWCTAVISLLTFLLGIAVTVASIALKN